MYSRLCVVSRKTLTNNTSWFFFEQNKLYIERMASNNALPQETFSIAPFTSGLYKSSFTSFVFIASTIPSKFSIIRLGESNDVAIRDVLNSCVLSNHLLVCIDSRIERTLSLQSQSQLPQTLHLFHPSPRQERQRIRSNCNRLC